MHLFILFSILCIGIASNRYSPFTAYAEAAQNDIPHILILNSYHQGFTWTDDIVAAITNSLSAELDDYELYIEYMDSKRYQDSNLDEMLFMNLSLKYQKLQPDIIITSDDKALVFIKTYHQQLFPKVPVVFCGVNNIDNAASADRKFFTGLIETLDISANIDLALTLFNNINEIVIVSDGTQTGIGTREMARDAAPYYPDIAFTYLNGESMSTVEMLLKLQDLTNTSVVIAPAWYLDKDGNSFDNNEIYPRISNASPVPVISTSSANIGLGIIGGKLNSGTIQGEYTARQVLRILSGETSVKDIPVEMTSQNRYMFDHRILKQFSVNTNRLPQDAVILFRPVPFYERYKVETAVAVTALAMLIVVIFFLSFNLSHRKKVEKILQESEARYRTLYNASFAGILIQDQEIILDCNQQLSDITGYPFAELIGMNFFENLIAPDFRDTFRHNMAGNIEEPFEIEGIKKDKSRYPLFISSKTIPFRGKSAHIVEFRDVTEQKKIEMEKLSLENQLQQSRKMESVGQLAGGIAHDFNNLLTPILGYAELLGINDKMRPASRDKLDQIVLAALKAKDLVQQLLAFSRQQVLSYQAIDLNEVITNYDQLIRRTIRENVDLSIIAAPDLKPVKADSGQIGQVLMNLLVNASDAMPTGGKLTIETRAVHLTQTADLENTGTEPGEYVLLSIQDTGVGMDKQTAAKAFEPFFTTKGELGTGLGLATVYGIIKQHNGNVQLSSTPGIGTTFYVYLPVTEGKTKIHTDEETSYRDHSGTETILLVEDNQTVRNTVHDILQNLGYDVVVASSGDMALELISPDRLPDLLLTDVVMPGMNGRDLYTAISKRYPSVKVLYMSGYINNDMDDFSDMVDQVNFIQKPFSGSVLGEKIKKVLDAR